MNIFLSDVFPHLRNSFLHYPLKTDYQKLCDLMLEEPFVTLRWYL